MNLSFGKCNGKRREKTEKDGKRRNGELENGVKRMMGKGGISVGMMGMREIRVGMREIEVGIFFQINL